MVKNDPPARLGGSEFARIALQIRSDSFGSGSKGCTCRLAPNLINPRPTPFSKDFLESPRIRSIYRILFRYCPCEIRTKVAGLACCILTSRARTA
jgi:hypothetical protein